MSAKRLLSLLALCGVIGAAPMAQAEDFPPLERLFSCPQWLEATQAQAPEGWTQRTLPRLKLRVALPPKTRVTMESDRVDLRTANGQVAVSLRRQRGKLGKDAHAAMIDIRQLEVGPSLCNRACLERAEANLRQASGWSSAALTLSGRPLAEPRRWIAGVFEDSHGLMTVVVSLRWPPGAHRAVHAEAWAILSAMVPQASEQRVAP